MPESFDERLWHQAATDPQHTTGAITTAQLVEVCRQMKCKADEYRQKRDEMFLALNSKGYVAFALDRGMGEEWVLSDGLCRDAFKLIDGFEYLSAQPGSNVSGVRIIPASEWFGQEKH